MKEKIEEKNKKDLKVAIEFQNSEIDGIILPPSYNSFIEKIREIYNLNLNSDLELTYYDEDDDPINLNSEYSYSSFIKQIEKDEIKAKVILEVKEEKNINKKDIISNTIETKEKYNEIHFVKNESNIINNNNIINNINITINQEIREIKNNDKEKINNKNNIIDFNKDYLIFPKKCIICNAFPIVDVLYYCLICSYGICKNCENNPEIKINHDDHTFLKIQSEEQYKDLVQKIFNNKKKSKDKKEEKPKKMNLIQIARSFYDFNNISDDKLKDVINQNNGDIKKAEFFLKFNKEI